MTGRRTPAVSVIMPAYGHEAYLEEAVASLQRQTFDDWECVVVTDGSPDDVLTEARRLADEDQRIVVLDTDNAGVAAARNSAIGHSSGEFLLPLDGDDTLSPDYLAACVDHLRRTPETRLVYGEARKTGLVDEEWVLPEYSWERLLLANPIHNSAMFRRTAFDEVGGYDPSMRDGLEDWEFWIRLLATRRRAVRLTGIRLHRRILDRSRTTLVHDRDQVAALNRRVYALHGELYESLFEDPQTLYRDHLEVVRRWEWVQAHPVRGSLLLFRTKYASLRKRL